LPCYAKVTNLVTKGCEKIVISEVIAQMWLNWDTITGEEAKWDVLILLSFQPT